MRFGDLFRRTAILAAQRFAKGIIAKGYHLVVFSYLSIKKRHLSMFTLVILGLGQRQRILLLLRASSTAVDASDERFTGGRKVTVTCRTRHGIVMMHAALLLAHAKTGS